VTTSRVFCAQENNSKENANQRGGGLGLGSKEKEIFGVGRSGPRGGQGVLNQNGTVRNHEI